MHDVVVIGFPDAAAARLAYDEVLNLGDNDDLVLEALALRTSGPAGRICIEMPDQLSAGGTATGPQVAGFLVAVLETGEAAHGPDCHPSDLHAMLQVSPAVVVFMASHIAWQRFKETMSVFDGVTIAMPTTLESR